MNVNFLPEIQEYFDELEIILYEKGYFSFEEDAKQYADDLFFDVKTREWRLYDVNIPSLLFSPRIVSTFHLFH